MQDGLVLLTVQDTDLEREYQVHRTEKDYALAEFWKWAIACLIGLAMGCIGFVVDWGINLLNDAKYQSTANVLRSHGMDHLCGTSWQARKLYSWPAFTSNAQPPYAGHATAYLGIVELHLMAAAFVCDVCPYLAARSCIYQAAKQELAT